MSDELVTVKELGGGWYEVKAAWEDEPHKVRGSEDAEALRVQLISTPHEDDAEEDVEIIEDEVIPDARKIPFDGSHQQRAQAPKEYTGTMTAAEKKAVGLPKTTRIILEENDDIPPTGLYLGHNGRGYMIVTGEPVDVPNFLIDILDNAIMAQPVLDPRTQKVVGYRDRMRYPYRRV